MKVKLSPFTILFLLLNSILIFCASRKIDSEKKQPSGLQYTRTDTQVVPSDNIDPKLIEKIKARKTSYGIEHVDHEKIPQKAKIILETSANDDYFENTAEQKDADSVVCI